jgi:hypothetical protein
MSAQYVRAAKTVTVGPIDPGLLRRQLAQLLAYRDGGPVPSVDTIDGVANLLEHVMDACDA